MPHPETPLPQEIVDLIIDQVAHSSENDRKKTLRACSTVSRSFYRQSQKHVFSDIEFLVDGSANRRAARLSKVLAHNSNLTSSIGSLKLIFIPTTKPSRSLSLLGLNNIYHRSRRRIHNVAGRVNLWRNYMTDILEHFSQLPIRKFVLEVPVKKAFLDWASFCRDQFEVDFTMFAFRIASNPALRSLTFNGIVGLPASFLVGRSQSNGLRELVLHYACFTQSSLLPLTDGSNHIFRQLTNITSLIMLNPSHSEFLSFLSPNLSPSTLFPHLTTLVVSLPSAFDEVNSLLEFTLAVSRALETLEFGIGEYFGSSFDILQRNFLGHFSALRHLSFKTPSFQTIALLHTCKLGIVSEILISAMSPIRLPSINIELHVDLGALIERQYGLQALWQMDTQDFYRPGWSGIDKGLTNPMFVNLQTINLDLKIRADPCHGITFDIHNFRPFLPRLHDAISIKFNFSAEMVSM